MDWLMWAPLMAASLHICEEFVIPGGFAAWYRRYRPDPSRITRRFLVLINAALLVGCWNVAAIGRNSFGIAYWLTMSAVLCSNGCWHAWASYKTHSYSPGVVTGVLVYVPLAVYGCSQFLLSGAISIWAAAIACIIGGSYHFWSAAYHGLLKKKA
jgi:hypothetical protein